MQTALKLKSLVESCLGLTEVEDLIRSKFNSESELLCGIPGYLLALGGKRIRPVLSLTTARALGLKKPSQALIDVSAGIEMIHMATLLHDDIIDKSAMRRHKESPYLKYGMANTLLAGDFLLVRAFSLCARLDQYIIDATEKACIELTEGEIDEVSLSTRRSSLQESLEIARKKTAALFRLATVSGAFYANVAEEERQLLGVFGETLGQAFQALDDILDVTSTLDLLGKPTGQDILERKPSLINVLWLNSGSSLAQELLGDHELSPAYVAQATKEIDSTGVLKEAKTIAQNFITTGLAALSKLSPGINRNFEDLKLIAEFTTSRLN